MNLANPARFSVPLLSNSFFLKHQWKIIGWFAACSAGVLMFSVWLHQHPHSADPLAYGYLETVGSVLAFTCAATALLRFRGSNDRVALLMALGLIVCGFIETFHGLSNFRRWLNSESTVFLLPMEWLTGRTFLALQLLLALYVEHRLPSARRPGRELIGGVALTIGVAYFTVLFYFVAGSLHLPYGRVMLPDYWTLRPPQLIPAALFLYAAVRCRRRLREANALFDQALYVMAVLSFVAHILASQTENHLDAPLVIAQFLKVASYAALLGGALLDHVRLFDQVRHMAASDPLTGLANYRRFNDAMRAELNRSLRTGRPFAILLLDLDGLKRINDTRGHEVGSRAICRLAEVLRLHCRTVDTASRFGGDEFALVLPETDIAAASRVAQRIRERLAADPEQPPLSVSIGVAVHPRHGRTVEALQRVADKELYAMKRSLRRKRKAAKAANAASAA